jgi:hypothetical protein
MPEVIIYFCINSLERSKLVRAKANEVTQSVPEGFDVNDWPCRPKLGLLYTVQGIKAGAKAVEFQAQIQSHFAAGPWKSASLFCMRFNGGMDTAQLG